MRKLFIILLALLVFINCKNTNRIKSSDYKNKTKKIKTLKKYFKVKSEIVDTEYDIYDVNINNRSIPGPTDRDYKIIIKVNIDDVEKWDEPNNITSFPINYEWANKLLVESNNSNFDLKGSNVQYKSEYKEMIIFKESGIILIHIVQH